MCQILKENGKDNNNWFQSTNIQLYSDLIKSILSFSLKGICHHLLALMLFQNS